MYNLVLDWIDTEPAAYREAPYDSGASAQRVPRSEGRAMVTVNEQIVIPETELSWTFARSGGPGGQNVNKVASKAALRWTMDASEVVSPEVKERIRQANPSRVTTEGELLIVSQEYRDQDRNREACLEKIAEVVRAALVIPKKRRVSKPSKASKQRRLTAKKLQSERKAGRRSPDRSE